MGKYGVLELQKVVWYYLNICYNAISIVMEAEYGNRRQIKKSYPNG